jgi:acetyl-CoA carboxylase biotin carboxyl carrier protein
MSSDQEREEDGMSDVELAAAQAAGDPASDPSAHGALVDPVPVGPGDAGSVHEGGPGPSGAPDDGAADDPVPVPALSGADAELLGLVDRLAAVLERSDLGELEVASGGTTILLRAPVAVERPPLPAPGVEPTTVDAVAGGAMTGSRESAAVAEAGVRPTVRAPLTGIFYGAPSPGATPYVSVGDHVSVGQIIGLIEAMKLFNEIKSDLTGRVVRICADNGALVKAKQALIEVESA